MNLCDSTLGSSIKEISENFPKNCKSIFISCWECGHWFLYMFKEGATKLGDCVEGFHMKMDRGKTLCCLAHATRAEYCGMGTKRLCLF